MRLLGFDSGYLYVMRAFFSLQHCYEGILGNGACRPFIWQGDWGKQIAYAVGRLRALNSRPVSVHMIELRNQQRLKS